MYFENANLDAFQNVSPLRHRNSSLSIHPYFGKVDPSIAIKAIELLSRPNDIVLDPFCGSGTVIHNALSLGRNAIGWDSSPLAILISTAKVLGITAEEKNALQSLVETICAAGSRTLFTSGEQLDDAPVPPMPRIRAVSDWFAPNALRELTHIKSRIEKAESALSPIVSLYAKLAFSRIITAASLQKGESSYCRTKKSDDPGRVLGLYENAVATITKAAKSFTNENVQVLGNLSPDRLTVRTDGYLIRHNGLEVNLIRSDSRAQEIKGSSNACAQLVTTSPPYLMSWDYGLYHKFRFYWLGFNLDAYEETEIGRHLRRKDDDVPRYIEDMTKIFARLKSATCQGGHVVMVNAPSVVYGKEIDTNELLVECGAKSDWKCVWMDSTIDIPGPHHGMYGSLSSRGASAPGAAGKKEHVLIFQKP